MEFFTFIWNCIISFIELLDNVPITNNFSALDFLLCCILFGIVISIVLKKRSSD